MMVKQTAVRNKVSVSYCFNFVSVRHFVFDTSMGYIYIGITMAALVYSHGFVDGVVYDGHLGKSISPARIKTKATQNMGSLCK